MTQPSSDEIIDAIRSVRIAAHKLVTACGAMVVRSSLAARKAAPKEITEKLHKTD